MVAIQKKEAYVKIVGEFMLNEIARHKTCKSLAIIIGNIGNKGVADIYIIGQDSISIVGS
jgi:hypothetical protein